MHEAGYPAQVDCRIVDATVTWGIRPAFWGAGPTTDDMHGLPDFGGTDGLVVDNSRSIGHIHDSHCGCRDYRNLRMVRNCRVCGDTHPAPLPLRCLAANCGSTDLDATGLCDWHQPGGSLSVLLPDFGGTDG